MRPMPTLYMMALHRIPKGSEHRLSRASFQSTKNMAT